MDFNGSAVTNTRFAQRVSRKRKYVVYRGGETISASIDDPASMFLMFLAENFPKETDRAIRHVGWWLQGTIKSEMKAEAPGGKRWPKGSEISHYRVLQWYRGKKGRAKDRRRDGNGNRVGVAKVKRRGIGKYTSLGFAGPKKGKKVNTGRWWPSGGDLIRAVGYKHHRGKMRAEIGWLSAGAAILGQTFQRGKTTQVTNKMRAFFALAGLNVPAKDKIVMPPRAVFTPVYQRRKKEIYRRIEMRVAFLLNESSKKFKKVG